MNPVEKRKFPRIVLHSAYPELTRLLKVAVRWPVGELSNALDMSYTGAALTKPHQSVSVGDVVELEFQIEDELFVKVSSEVLRVGEQTVAIRFHNLSSAARSSFERFMAGKMRGLSLRLVNPHYYGPKEDFSYWFCGPNETHIFIWINEKSLNKAWIQLGREVLLYDEQGFSEGRTEDGSMAAQISSPHVQGMSPLMFKALELASQVQEGHELLEPLIQVLSERVPA